MKIKKVGIEDLRELQKIGIESYIPHYSYLWKTGGLDWYLEGCFGDEFLKNEIADKNVEYYIISSEDKNIGILKFVLHKPLPNSDIENALYLEKIYFIPEWTGKGIGRELINFTFDRAKELNRDCVWLVAMDTSDKPVAAYERAGFTIHCRQRIVFNLMKDEFRGTFVMKKSFETTD